MEYCGIFCVNPSHGRKSLNLQSNTPAGSSSWPCAVIHRLLWGALLITMILSIGNLAYAQSSASISGTVTDPSGAKLVKAHIAIKNVDTNVEQTSITTGAGTYSIINVPPGRYSITVTMNGFSPETENGIVLEVSEAAIFNFAMKVGSSDQTVTVSAENVGVETSTAELGTVIGNKEVNNLPLNGRNFTQLLELTPGVSRVSVGQNAAGGVAAHPIGQFTYPSVNGQRNRSNMFALDGGNNDGQYTGTYNYAPIIDDVQEFKVQTHDDLAEFGQVTGGIVNVVTKGGTNSYHGSLYDYIRNNYFDAGGYFATAESALRQNQFGGTFGGPVRLPRYDGRNRTFFFFAYEGFRQTQATQSTLVTTPTAAQLNGDFSNLLAKGIVIYNPFSTQPDPAHPGQYLRTAFPNNQIPPNLLSSAALAYAKAIFPAPSTSLPGGNVYDNTPIYTNSDSYTVRVDQAIGQHDLLYGRLSIYTEPYSSSTSLPNTLNENVLSGYNLAVREVHTFNPTSVLEAYFTRNIGTDKLQLTYLSAPSNFGSTLIADGFSSSFLSGFAGPQSTIIPGISITGYLGVATAFDQTPNNANTYEYGAAFSKVLGRHTIKVGASMATNNFQEAIDTATETTSSFQTSNLENPTSPSGASTGDALASFLLGVPTSATRRTALEREHGGYVNGGYIQDQFKVMRNLTINFGERWDVTVWPVYGYLGDGQGYVGDMNLANGTYVLSAVPPACSSTQGAPCIPSGTLPANVVVTPFKNRALHGTDYSNWQTRVGFAYQPAAVTSVHGAYGRFYDEWSVNQAAQNVGGTWPSVGLLSQASLNSTTPTNLIGDPLLLGSTTIQPAATPFGNATTYVSPNEKTPFSDQWNLGIDQAFGKSAVLIINYVGSHSSRLDLGGLHNTAEYPAAGTAAQVASRREYPYIVPTSYSDSVGNSNYNALQTSLRESGSHGLTYLFSYTWSKSIDLACSGYFGVEGCLLQDPYHPQTDRSVSGFDLTNIFSASVVYEIPFGRGRAYQSSSAVVNGVLGGWQVNSITSFTSGAPYSVTVTGDIANVGNTLVQANLVGNPNPANRSASEWINPAAFVSPPRYTFGTFGRNALRSDGYKDEDLSLFKNFRLPDNAALEFRAEVFNLTNTQIFAAPTSTVGSPTFGVISALATPARQMQFALKILF